MTDRKTWELTCYGTTEAEIRRTIDKYADIYTPNFMAFSMLSDVQELLERDQKEAARQKINVVKFIIDTYLKGGHRG